MLDKRVHDVESSTHSHWVPTSCKMDEQGKSVFEALHGHSVFTRSQIEALRKKSAQVGVPDMLERLWLSKFEV